MLKDKLYTVSSLKDEDNGRYTIEILLNTEHEIFKGHFPTQPILPGVCLIEMVKEFLVEIKGKPFRLLAAQNIKFLRLVDPNEEPKLRFELEILEEEAALKVNISSFLKDGTANFKLKGNFA